jgi:hypothetical protein
MAWLCAITSLVLWAAPPAAGQQRTTTVEIVKTVGTNEQRDGADWVLAIVQMGAGVAAAFGLIALALQINTAEKGVRAANKQIEHAQDDARRQRTVAFQDRFTSPEFANVHARVKAFFVVKDARDVVDKIRSACAAPHAADPSLPRTPRDPDAPMASHIDLHNVLGFYENIGAAYKLKQLDTTAFERTFGPLPAEAFAIAWWYVCWKRGGKLREPGKPTAFAEFEDLARALVERHSLTAKELEDGRSFGAFVLPDAKCTDAAVWDLCGRLSAILDKAPPLVALAPTAVSTWTLGEHRLVKTVIAVPPGIGIDQTVSEHYVRAAATLEARLRALTMPELEALVSRHHGDQESPS